MAGASQASSERGEGSRRQRWWPVPVALLAAGGFLLADPWPYRSPVEPAKPLAAWVVDTSTVRTPPEQSELQFAGYTYFCNDCHRIFTNPDDTPRELAQHEHIKLEHGLNNRCFNCHHPTDRNSFVDDFGKPIPYDEPERLCAKCHGPVYRDWTNGSHGRTNGYWDGSLGPRERQTCSACHDPHTPAFPSMRPAPGPRTLRMGPQAPSDELHEDSRNPLLIYRRTGHVGDEEDSEVRDSDRTESHERGED